MFDLNLEATSREIEGFVRQQVQDFRRDGAIVGLSGGIDSAVVAALCVRSLGADRVWGVTMPERDSDPRSKSDARLVAQRLGITTVDRNVTSMLRRLGIYRWVPPAFPFPRQMRARYTLRTHRRLAERLGGTPFAEGLSGSSDPALRRMAAYVHSKHRVRTVVLYMLAELRNLLVVGTCNRTEWLIGFFVQYGDSAADIMPLQGLYKTQVRALAAYLNVPQNIIEKAPSPDLAPGLTDEQAIGVPYERLDRILLRLEQGRSVEEVSKELGVEQKEATHIAELISRSEYLRTAPVALELSVATDARRGSGA